jgi:hypothetical protein
VADPNGSDSLICEVALVVMNIGTGYIVHRHEEVLVETGLPLMMMIQIQNQNQ